MPQLPPLTAKDFRRFDDALDQALRNVDDFQHGPWWLRCIEFHFGPGVYRITDSFDWHCHKEIQIEIPLTGKFEFALKHNNPVSVESGQVFTIPPEFSHRWKCLQSGVMLGILLVVIPKPDAIAYPVSPMLSPGLSPKPLSSSLSDAFMDELVFNQGDEISTSKRLTAWIYLIINRLLNDVLKVPAKGDYSNADTKPLSRSQRIVSKLMRYIEANIGGNLSIEQLEHVVGLSGRQIQRLFLETTGCNCHQYVMERRIEISQSMMTSYPNISIKEVAYACGFSSPAHFATNFKKSVGVSPSDFNG